MNYTNLNIVSQGKSFKYIVEYYDDPALQSTPLQYYRTDEGIFFLNSSKQNVIHKKNYWVNEHDEDTKNHLETVENKFVPPIYNRSSFNIYFPRYAVETYSNNVKYVLTINTWINEKYVYLGSVLLDRSNAIACESGVRKFMNEEYYEYLHIDTIDPVHLVYGDEWKDFRVNICGEKQQGDFQPNNTASNLNFTLTAVHMYDNAWVKLDNYDSSQSAILLNNSINNYMQHNLQFVVEEGIPVFKCKIQYNTMYESLREYILETYQLDVDECECKFLFVVKDKNNAYKYIEHIYTGACDSTRFEFDEIKFSSWNEYIQGMCATAVFVVSKDDNDILVLSSNQLMIHQDIFKYLVCESPIKKLNFDSLDNMNTQKFDVVNVIEHKVVTVERPEDYKANLIRPVFVKVQEAGTIRLHPLVTENIVLNLDAYKNKVETFILKINNANFYEIGRINTGIVFRIVGSNLAEQEQQGTYYILNENGELVTTGNYILVL